MKGIILLFYLLCLCLSILDRTYYKALKIPISAGPQQIKSAYRKLSRKYHPDRNPNAKSKFQKINVAYQTLSNEENKYLYDRLGREKMNDPNIQNQVNVHELKGPSLQIPFTVTLEDLYQGKKIESTIFKNMACPHCLGSGAQNQYDIVRCSECQGQGKKVKKVSVGGGYYNMMSQQCPRCKGQGKIVGRKCSTCDGNKLVNGAENFTVNIQPGTQNGERLKYINMGEQLMKGAPGDLIIRIKQAPHKSLTRIGDQLHANIYISLEQALFGFERKITQLDGRQLTVSKNGVSQPNQLIVIQRQGMPIKGTDLIGQMVVKINVRIPQYNQNELEKLRQTFSNL